MRSTAVAPFLLLAMLCSSALGQDMALEPDLRSDVDHAVELGFEILPMRDQHGTEARARISEEIVRPIAEHLSPGVPYGFAFHEIDIDGNGALDVVVVLKMPYVVPPEGFDGAATLIYMNENGHWRLALEGGSMAVGVRGEPGSGLEVALVQLDDLKIYAWNNDALIAQ